MNTITFKTNDVVKSIATGNVAGFQLTLKVDDLLLVNARKLADGKSLTVQDEASVIEWLELKALSIRTNTGCDLKQVNIKLTKANDITVLADGVIILSSELMVHKAHIDNGVLSGLLEL